MALNLNGFYRGIVTDIADPNGLYRLRAIVPALAGMTPLNWADPCFKPGDFHIPAVGSPVWITFEAGDINNPIWMGVWAVAAAPPPVDPGIDPPPVIEPPPDGSTDVVLVKYNNTAVATRSSIDFHPGTGITMVVADDAANGDVDVTISTPALLPSFYTQKGGVVLGTGVGTVSMLAPGSDGQFLIYDSTQATGHKKVQSGGMLTATWTGAITVGDGKIGPEIGFPITIWKISARFATALGPTGSAAKFNFRKNGATDLLVTATGLQVAAGATQGRTTTFVAGANVFAADDYILIDIDNIGGTLPGSDVVITFNWTPS